MSYEPYTWKGGDIATATKLNHIEQGVADASSSGGFLLVNTTYNNDQYIMDKTAQEILDAMGSGIPVFVLLDNETDYIRYGLILEFDAGRFGVFYGFNSIEFTADSPSSYPFGSEDAQV